ncbi:DUF342 domain-containing protein [Alkalihalobacterium chitinilyticum]|uniref:FapA family protein n=1 Tax=Alkalihalobacterium chitinilyticum TaxID=2980103 RepID=A0ABT5VBW2_9BACI|nr:FapA family protein [Alkalihalobacterium chitinilyticum]MDE5412941.1 FapA family protein [Alkalihalobacterium chitinilyticum]
MPIESGDLNTMTPLDGVFEIIISKDKMNATLIQNQKLEAEYLLTMEQLRSWIKEHGVVSGINESNLKVIIDHVEPITSPIVIAEGKSPINGRNAFLQANQFGAETDENEEGQVDLKKVITIPSVSQGQTVGRKVEATAGQSGINVFGEEIPAKPGRDFILRPGKNTAVSEDKLSLIAQVDGQQCIDRKTIHVYPVYEVQGDLDMKTGNIDFIGNVTIRGNVPAGFKVKAKGDIRIQGTVEAATIISEGSIFVAAGIAGQGKGLIKAKKDIHTTFINQGNVEADGDLHVNQSILHSKCTVNGSIYCNKGKGNLVGGQLSAGKEIFAKEIGNSMHTQTELFIGVHQQVLADIEKNKKILTLATGELEKLNKLLHVFELKEKQGQVLQANERIMKLRVRNTLLQTEEKKVTAQEELTELNEELEQGQTGSVRVERSLLPNVTLTFGKYRRKITATHQNVKVFIMDSEIQIVPL